jgi:hypothetical protein
MAKTVIGLFDNLSEVQEVIQDLVRSGVPAEKISLAVRDDLGLYARHLREWGDQDGADHPRLDYLVDEAGDEAAAAKGAEIGAALGGIAGLLLSLGVPALPGLGPVLAAGPLLTTLTGTGIGAVTGGMIGALTKSGIADADAGEYAEGLRRGGALVMVDTGDEMADQAAHILNQYHPVDLEERASGWQKDNWQGFNEPGETFAFDQIEKPAPDQPAGKRRKRGPGARVYPAAKPKED